MIPEELSILERTRGAIWERVFSNRRTWEKAINEFNNDHPDQKPMKIGCRPCLFKVQAYLKNKYDKA